MFYTTPRQGETSAADKMKAVHIVDFLKALLTCKSTISSIIDYMLLYDIFTPSSIFWPSFHTHNFSIRLYEGENQERSNG